MSKFDGDVIDAGFVVEEEILYVIAFIAKADDKVIELLAR